MSEVRAGGQEELSHIRGHGRQPRRATPCLRPGAADGWTYPSPKAGGMARRSNPPPRSGGCTGTGGPRGAIPYSRSKGWHGEIPLVQGKEQWLHFAGVAVKRYPTSKVRETQVRR